MTDLTLLGICGSLRAASTNRLLMLDAARRFDAARFIEADIRFPLFDEDTEKGPGIPEAVTTLAQQIKAADAVIVTTPEYNKGISGALKNALDWVSRTPDKPWHEKPVAVLSAAAGRAGGQRAQSMLRLCLTPFQPRLLTGPEVVVGETAQQWDDQGRLSNAHIAKPLDALMTNLRNEALWMRDRGAA